MEKNNIEKQKATDLYTLLAPVLSDKVSKRCGKGICVFYDKHSKISGCKDFEDR